MAKKGYLRLLLLLLIIIGIFYAHVSYSYIEYRLMALSEMYDKAWKMILSPEPFRHKPIEFGPKERSIGDWRIRRTDIKVKNTRGRQI